MLVFEASVRRAFNSKSLGTIKNLVTILAGQTFHVIRSSSLSKSFLLLVFIVASGLSSTAFSAVPGADRDSKSVSNAYAQLFQAEHQLLKSELAIESRKSTSFESLLADGHASWLENRQQRLVVDILKAKLAAYEQFEPQAKVALTGEELKFEHAGADSIQTRLATVQELQTELATLQQKEQKLAHGLATLSTNDSWAEGYRLRHALTSHQANVVAAKIVLLERLNASQDHTNSASELVSTTDQAATFTAAWKRPSKDSSSMQLLITQAELQIQLSQHHLLNESRRLTGLQELADRGMATKRAVIELKKNADAIRELLKEQQDNLSWLKKDLDVTTNNDQFYTSTEAGHVSPEMGRLDETSATQTNLSVLPSVLNQFELGQANYQKHEAILKGEMYQEILSRLERAVASQVNQTQFNQTSANFSNVLVRGQQRELEQYRWKIKKTQLQRDLAEAQISLLKDGSQSENLNLLVSTGASSRTPATFPSRFTSSDPFGLQTTYSAFVYNSPRYRARRPALTSTRGDYSSVFRPVINRNALSFYRGLESSRFGSSYGLSRGYSSGYVKSGFRYFRPPGQSPFYFPGSPSSFGASRFPSNSFNSFGRSNQFYHSSGPGYYSR